MKELINQNSQSFMATYTKERKCLEVNSFFDICDCNLYHFLDQSVGAVEYIDCISADG